MPGVGGLVAEGPVELGGVPHRLVDGEPQVGGVDDEVVGARLHRRRRHLLGQQRRGCVRARRPSPNPARRCTPSPGPTGGARVRIDSNDPDSASTATASTTGWMRTRRWVVTVPDRSAKCLSSTTASTRAATWSTAADAESRPLQSSSSATLSASGTVGGVHARRATSTAPRRGRARRPARRGVPSAVAVVARPAPTASSASRAAGVGVELDGGGEPDGPVAHHAQPDPDLGVVDGGLDPRRRAAPRTATGSAPRGPRRGCTPAPTARSSAASAPPRAAAPPVATPTVRPVAGRRHPMRVRHA